jgi:hypothetical protein
VLMRLRQGAGMMMVGLGVDLLLARRLVLA